MIARLMQAWRHLVDTPALPHDQGQIVLTGPLPPWLYATLQAEAERQQRPLADIIYQAIYYHGTAIVRHQAELKGLPHEQ